MTDGKPCNHFRHAPTCCQVLGAAGACPTVCQVSLMPWVGDSWQRNNIPKCSHEPRRE